MLKVSFPDFGINPHFLSLKSMVVLRNWGSGSEADLSGKVVLNLLFLGVIKHWDEICHRV